MDKFISGILTYAVGYKKFATKGCSISTGSLFSPGTMMKGVISR